MQQSASSALLITHHSHSLCEGSSIMEGDKQHESIAAKKLKALQSGLLQTDVLFHVGPEDETAEEIAAIKSDLVLSSEYFARLFSSTWMPPPEGKIRLKNVEACTFRLVVEFSTLSGHLLSEVAGLQNCLCLARAADEFLMRDLSRLCAQLLEDKFINVGNVWTVLNQHYQVSSIASPCLKLLSKKTKLCLQPNTCSFKARLEVIQQFLALDKMNHVTEAEILDWCLLYLEHHGLQRDTFRQYFLPGLRLLTLDRDIGPIVPFLTSKEVAFLLSFYYSDQTEEPLEIQPTLCPILEPRGGVKTTLTLIPRRKVLAMKELFLSEQIVEDLQAVNKKFTLTLCPKRSITVHDFEMFCLLDWKVDNYHRDTWELRLKNEKLYESAGCVTVSSTVTTPKKKCSQHDVRLPDELPYNSWIRVKHFAVVPAGATLTLTVTVNTACILRDTRFKQNDLKLCNASWIEDSFERISVNSQSDNQYNSAFPNDLCIFRTIQFSEV